MQASSDTEAISDVGFDVCSVGCLNLTVLVAGLRALASDEEPSTLGTLNSYNGKGRAEGGNLDYILRPAYGTYVSTHASDVVHKIMCLLNIVIYSIRN